jgi:hypothetical protein
MTTAAGLRIHILGSVIYGGDVFGIDLDTDDRDALRAATDTDTGANFSQSYPAHPRLSRGLT